MRVQPDPGRRQRMAQGALSHLIGAYYLLGGLICDCDPQKDKHMRTILLHAKGIYWTIMQARLGISNPKRDDSTIETRGL